VLPVPAGSQSESTLRDRIERGRERERALSGALAELDGLLARVRREVAIIQGRLDEVQADLVAAEARLADTRERLVAERVRLGRLRSRLAEGRATLAAQLVQSFKADRPDVVSFVLGSHDFADLIERVEFVERVEERNAVVIDRVRRARDETRRQAALLARLEVRQEEDAEAVERRRDALAAMRDGLAERQATLERIHAARADALAGTRARRRAAESSLRRLIAERERAAAQAVPTSAGGPSPGPGGPWAIPWPIVQCESGGQNLTPNGAGASGYYQMLPETWRGLGGSTPHAYQAPKAEQDRLASALWAGGSGAHNWVCAELVE
jgi:septal ring factor EnvC (AmiA/AmiB activator)